MALPRSRMIGFMLVRFFVSSWMRRKTRSQVTLGVVLPILGVSIGVASFTIILSVMGGFVGNLKTRLLGVEPHIEVVKSGEFGYLTPSDALLSELLSRSEVTGVGPFQKGDTILQSNSRPVTAVVTGIDPKRIGSFERFEKSLTGQSSISALNDEVSPRSVLEDKDADSEVTFPPVILGSGVARALDVQIGERVTFVSTIPEEGPFGLAPKQSPAVVVDILRTGSRLFDAKAVFTSLNFANDFFGTGDVWAGLQVGVKPHVDVDTFSKKLDPKLEPLKARAKPWTESNKALLRALQLERWGMSFVLYMVILVGCFTITITLVLSVKRKAREMAVLRAIGFQRYELGFVYLFQGLLIGVVGVALGLGVGLLCLEVLSSTQIPMVNALYNGRPFPVVIHWPDIIAVAVGSTILSGFASVWPAWEVIKIDVVETLSDRG